MLKTKVSPHYETCSNISVYFFHLNGKIHSEHKFSDMSYLFELNLFSGVVQYFHRKIVKAVKIRYYNIKKVGVL